MNKGLRVLLADLNDHLYPALAEAVEAAGNMNLLGLSTSGRETLRLCRELQPDVLVLELVLPELDGLAVLRELKSWEQRPLVMVLTGFTTALAVNMAMEAGAAFFLSKPCPPQLIAERILGVASLCPAEKKRAESPAVQKSPDTADVSELLRELGVSARLKGYTYLREAILLTLQEGREMKLVTKCLYPAVAKCYATTASRVERSIRHAVELSWERGDPELRHLCFGNSVSLRGRPTNSQYIAALAEYLRMEQRRGVM